MGKCPVIRGDGVMRVGTDHSDPSVGDYADTSPFEWGGKHGVRRYVPIVPPPFFVIAITDGRGGMPSLKSGQRVEGFS
jgi:hypothetical protein